MSFVREFEESVKAYCSSHALMKKSAPLLIGVSGGPDSMALLTFLCRVGYKPFVLHANYGLRAEASHKDEELVVAYARKLGLQYEIRDFSKDISPTDAGIQEQARKLRRSWFFAYQKELKGSQIVLAHHLNDALETFYINSVKGSGIRGFRSIKAKQDGVIRPFLGQKKEAIGEYVKALDIPHRLDESNVSDKYHRNFIRNRLIPLMKQINPSLEDTFLAQQEVAEDIEQIYKDHCKRSISRLLVVRNGLDHMSVKGLSSGTGSLSILHEWLQGKGFSPLLIKQIYRDLKAGNLKSGRFYESENHQLLVDRKYLILRDKNEENMACQLWQKGSSTCETTEGVLIAGLFDQKPQNPDEGKYVAWLDADRVEWPLVVRKWRKGDYMYPLGMNRKKKKLGKMFINEKWSQVEKEKAVILYSGEKTVWIPGLRIDERFKVQEQSTKFLRLALKKHQK